MNISITKQQLASLPAESFQGEIVIVDSLEGVAEAVSCLRAAPVIGFDTETKPAFQKGQINKVALLQLATPEKTFLFRLNLIGLPQEVRLILEDPSLLKVGLSIKDDFHSLAKIGNLSPAGFVDLQDYVKEFGIADCSLTKIHSIIFGRRISKSQQLTNWEAPSLTRRQQEYAALDALACINIYTHLSSGSFRPNT